MTAVRATGAVSAIALALALFVASPLYERVRGWWARRSR